MSTDHDQAKDLAQEIHVALRDMSAATVMLHATIAERLGLGPTDHKCMDLLLRHGPMTAGELAGLTGLTSGAITGVVDRLERSGFADRVRDTTDRRRVIVRPTDTPELMARVGGLFEGLARRMDELLAEYEERDLGLLRDFITRSVAVAREETARLRAAEAGAGPPDPLPEPSDESLR